MELNDLEQVLKEVPIFLFPKVIFRVKKYGLAINVVKTNKTALNYTVLPYECDDLVRGLLRQSLHHYYGGLDKKHMEFAENLFWGRPKYRKACQNKIVELLGKRDL